MFNFEEGEILLINKPYQWTSHEAVHHVRRSIHSFVGHKVKIGHAGTLDPLATGVLVLLTGKLTKKMESIQQLDKEYTGVITLGKSTPSYDLETQYDKEYPIDHIDEKLIKETVLRFQGDITQIPPTYSAVKIKGKHAYDYAREGEEVVVQPRQVSVYSFEIPEIDMPDVRFKIRCSKGTYIRTIANDFGKAMNSGSHLSELCRTAIGDYKIADALSPLKFREVLESLKTEANKTI